MAPAVVPRERWPLPCLLLLLLLPGPARGNEGGAAGSCPCTKHENPPDLLAVYRRKPESCDTCKDFTRFNFRNRKVCGLKQEAWVISYRNSLCPNGHPEEGAGRADASRGHLLPTPSMPGPAPTSGSSAGISSGKSHEMPRGADSPPDVAGVPTMAGTTPEPSAEAAARGGTRAPLEEKRMSLPPVSDAKTPVIALLCVALLSFGFAVSVLCWWRRWRNGSPRGHPPQTPLGEEEEGTLSLAGEKT